MPDAATDGTPPTPGATPRDHGFRMPAEWAPHAGCWMAWPCRDSLWGDGLEAARDAYAAVAAAIARFEPVTMIAARDQSAAAAARCGGAVRVLTLAHDDSWTRDTGPTFVVDGAGAVAGVDWRFDGWGGVYPDHAQDDAMAQAILTDAGARRYAAPIVLEGGSIHVDGEGTLLTTEQCLLDGVRNPRETRASLEAHLRAFVGAKRVIWLGEGLADDETSGHVDNIACFAAPGRVIALTAPDPADANRAPLAENLDRLKAARDAQARPLEVIPIEQPAPRFGVDGERLSLSYVNFYLANGAVIMPAFDDPADEPARATLKAAFPDRTVVQLPALAIVAGGGGIHCITQQQPAGTPAPEGD